MCTPHPILFYGVFKSSRLWHTVATRKSTSRPLPRLTRTSSISPTMLGELHTHRSRNAGHGRSRCACNSFLNNCFLTWNPCTCTGTTGTSKLSMAASATALLQSVSTMWVRVELRCAWYSMARDLLPGCLKPSNDMTDIYWFCQLNLKSLFHPSHLLGPSLYDCRYCCGSASV